ncbi:hypothetical protein ACTFIW_009439 [Dictyostelium discoideum]
MKNKSNGNNIEDIDNCSDNTKQVQIDFILTQNQIQRKRKIDSEYYQLFSIEGTNQDKDLIDATELKKLKVHFEILLESNKDAKSQTNLIESVEKLSKSLDNFKEEIKNEISNKFNELKNQIIDSNTELLGCFNLMREDYKNKINNMEALLSKISDSTDFLSEIKSNNNNNNNSNVPKNIIKANTVNGGVKYKIYNHQQPSKINENQIDDIIKPIKKPIIKYPSKKHPKTYSTDNNNNIINNKEKTNKQ